MLERTTLRRLGRSLRTVGWIAAAVTGWVVGCSLLFLSTGWPRWAFYAAVIGGTIAFVQLVTRG